MRNEMIDQLQDKIIQEALKKIDVDSLAEKLAKDLQKRLKADIQLVVNDRLDFSDWLYEELTNPDTKAGKIFDKSIEAMTEKMASALLK
jgi:ATP-dependent Clp protease ATP-binding subunit ClpA